MTDPLSWTRPLWALLLAAALPLADAATLVVANKAEATASLIDLASGEVVATLPTGEGPHEVAISPDGRRALVTDYGRAEPGNSLTLIDIPARKVLKTIDLGPFRRPHGVEFVDQTQAAVTVEDNRALIVVDLESAEVVASIDTDQEVSHMVALGPAGRAWVANIGSGSVSVLDLDPPRRRAIVPTGEGAEGIAVTAGGARVWVTNRAEDTITVLDAGTLEPLAELSSPGFPIRATASAAGQVLVTRARAGDLAVYDDETRELVRTVAFDLESLGGEERLFGERFGKSSVPIGVVVDATGSRAFVAHANADAITEVDLSSGAVLRVLRAGREPDGMGWSARSAAPPDQTMP